MSTTLRIATRQSRLALWQAEHVATRLRQAHPGLDVVLVPMTTQGDRILDRALALVGGKGLFIKELEYAIVEGRADLAVHSMKDVPAQLPAGMVLSAFLERADPRDAFVSLTVGAFEDLPRGARVGTSSQRRQCQLRHARPDIETHALRGNVETRLGKLAAGEFDAIILAAAGLTRLGLADRITQLLDTRISMPAVGQGIVGIECGEDDVVTRELTAVLDDPSAHTCINAERAMAHELEGNCQSPIAGHAVLEADELHIEGLVGSPDGRLVYRERLSGAPSEAAGLGSSLGRRLLDAGARELLAALRAGAC
jgi:hydroxymethylbilane synthase